MSPSLRASRASDERLVKECLKGDQDAWAAFLAKYKSLIYSVPLKYGLSHDQANDIFQIVCMQILRRLETVRDFNSLPAWLIKVTTNACFYWISKERRFEPSDIDTDLGPAPEVPEEALTQIEQEQILREALAALNPRCRELLNMLFFQTPALPYAEVAKQLGLATGSIGFIRMRCLQRLRRHLEERKFV
jgi:RNA polymerase sigma factor (sigma-70 family)